MVDQTPDPIDVSLHRAITVAVGRMLGYGPEPEIASVALETIEAAGFQVVPVVDDETREDVLDAVRHAKDTLTEVAVRYPSWGSELRLAGRTLDDLAAAYLGRND